MKKTFLLSILVVALLLNVAVVAQAQQAVKIFRIGYPDPSTASDSAVLWEALRQGLSKFLNLGMLVVNEQRQ